MKEFIVEFIDLLRKAGVGITVSEATDALKGLELVDLNPRYIRPVLKSMLVKSRWEEPVFESLFDLYFDLSPGHFSRQNDSSQCQSIIIKGASADGSGRASSGAGGDAQNFLETIDSQPFAILEELARQFTLGVELDDFSAKEVQTKLRKTQVGLRWFEAVNWIERRYAAGQVTESDFIKWQDTFKELEKLIKRELEKKAVRHFGRDAILPLVEAANIRRQEFIQLSTAQVAAVEQEVMKLAKRLAQKPGIRLKRAKTGKIDLRRTLKEVVRTGGCPIDLKFRDKIKSKVDLWLLCDVSNSVEQFSRFMLQLVQAAQKRYSEVRSFVFVDEAVEVTEWFRCQDVNAFLEARHLRNKFNRRVGLSRYDLVFEQIARYELPAISARTKIIILGDGRNNWQRSKSQEFAKIAECCQAIYWLNPLPPEEWQTGDCLMNEYGKYCRQVFECRNLEQLTEVANQIL